MKYFKVFLFILLSTLPLAAQSPFNWIIPNTDYLKMHISENGIYRINKSDFTQAGINTSPIDPRTVKVFYKGNEIPVYFEGESDGTFDDNDFIDLYAVRNYGGLTNTYRENVGSLEVHYVTDEYYNIYSDTSIYWIGWGGNTGLRLTRFDYSSDIPYGSNFFFEKAHFEKDRVYSLGETFNPNTDFRYFNTEKVSGEGWYWTLLQSGEMVSDTFSTPFVQNNPPIVCSFRIFAYPNSTDQNPGTQEHRLNLKVNNNTIAALSRDGYNRFDTTVTFSSSLLSTTGVNTINAVYTPTAAMVIYFDLMEISYSRQFKMQNNQLHFETAGNDSSSRKFHITGFNPSNPLYIYDTKNNLRTTTFSTSSDGDTLFFTGKGNGTFNVINRNITKKPFRIERRQVPDLVSTNNAADYLLVYHCLFTSQAEQLREHRQHNDTMRAFKASIEDITDIFGYGMENALALRNFIDYVYLNWQLPVVKYICLMGRGSLDPKNNLNLPWYKNFIPVYGNPQSDAYYGNNNGSGFTYFQKIPVGRLPVYTVEEAQNVVNKLIAYDQQPPDNWWKTFIMITGGGARSEQLQFQFQGNNILNQYIIPPPLSMDPHRIYRNDSTGYPTFNYADSIKHDINRGALIVNFIGHAASQDWEVGLQDPNNLTNGNKLPMVLSMTCFTGRNSEPSQRGFGEKFIYLPMKCAIGFLGTTGWSFENQGNVYNNLFLNGVAQNNIRRLGDALKFATLQMSPDSSSFPTRNMINSYGLLGDPATRLLLPVYPEFVITTADYRISNPYPILGEPVNLTIYPRNLGVYANDCLTRFEIYKSGSVNRFKDTLLTSFGYLDTAEYNFTIDTLGNYYIKVTLDYDNRYPQEIENNNIITIPLPIRDISYLPLKPVNNSIIRGDTVEFSGLNPGVDRTKNIIKVLLQCDTSRNFIQPLFTGTNSNIQGVVTRFFFRLPVTDSNTVYYWRTNSVINNDSSGWSAIQKFIINRNIRDNRKNSVGDSIVSVYYKLPGQFNSGEINNLTYNGNGFVLNSTKESMISKSFGSNSFQASLLIVGNYQFISDGGQNKGLNIGKVRKLTGKIIQVRNFYMGSPQSSDSVLNFLNSFDTTQYIILYITSDAGADSLRQNAKNRMKLFGSNFVDSIRGLNGFDTWSFIGFLGAAINQTSEEFHRWPTPGCPDLWCPSMSSISITVLNTEGNIFIKTGPSHRWKYFLWDEVLVPQSIISFNVSGISFKKDTTILYSGLTNNQFVALDSVDSRSYPSMLFSGSVSIDSISGTVSPLFKSFLLKYTPPAELIPDNYSFVLSDTVIQEGDSVTISIRNYNAGYVPSNVLVNKWSATSPSGIITLKIDTLYNPLAPDSSKVYNIRFSTEGLRRPGKHVDTISVFFETHTLNENDYYNFNNFAFTHIIVTGDTLGPRIDVTFDGKYILDNDYIRSRPEIKYKFFDNSRETFTLADTSGIKIKLNDSLINYYINGNPNPLIQFNPVNENDLKVIVTFNPVLSEGHHIFSFIGKDKNDNGDTLQVAPNVTSAFVLRNLYNVPNPMKSDTWFVFDLLASEIPGKAFIKIYSVSGRLIKEINIQPMIGYNQIYWDGRDNDGDFLANGIYLYKMIIQDAGKTEPQIQKLAVLK